MQKNQCHRCLFLVLLSVALLIRSNAQEKDYIAIIPAFHDRLNTSGMEGPFQLQNQKFVLFVYRNAVAVYSEADFVNTGTSTLSQEFAIPSTGHDENGVLPGGRISTGILNVQLWVQGQRIAPEFINDGTEEWYTIKTQFAAGEQKKMKALFWAQTSLTDVDSLPGLDTVIIMDGKRGFMVDLAHTAIWNGSIETISITMVLMENINVKQSSFNADPDTYEVRDSTLTWKIHNVEPSTSDNIFVWYSSSEKQKTEYNTMATLSTYIVKSVNDNLLLYVKRLDEE